MATNVTPVLCYHCSDVVTAVSTDSIGCAACAKWAHRACANVKSITEDEIKQLNWICSPCLDLLKIHLRDGEKILNKLDKLQKSMEESISEATLKFNKLQESLDECRSDVESVKVLTGSAEQAPSSYANVAKKNLLIVKSTDDAQKASDKKGEILNALSVTVTDTKFAKSGNVVLNFESAEKREEAAREIERLPHLSVSNSRKLFPKIMICNVNGEEDKDNIVATLINKNAYLSSVDDIVNKIKLVFVKNAAGATKHYILKCDPEVRGLIRKKGDEMKLDWGVYKVRDRFFATMCYHCLDFGHVKSRCPNKEDSPCCRKCAGNHLFKDCTSETKKCVNCKRAKKACTDHSAGEMCCPVMKSEIANIESRTDHGYGN